MVSKSDDGVTSVVVIGHHVVYFRLPFVCSIFTAKASHEVSSTVDSSSDRSKFMTCVLILLMLIGNVLKNKSVLTFATLNYQQVRKRI
jgi:hypothetical protein